MARERDSRSSPWYRLDGTSLLPLRIKKREMKILWKTPRKMIRSKTDIKVSLIILLI
jgi:hypothetical protein